MSREASIASATEYFDSGQFKTDLARRVAIPTESQNKDRLDALHQYINEEMIPCFEEMGFKTEIIYYDGLDLPFLYAERIEDENLVTVLGYGHGDVIRGLDNEWADGLSPWEMTEKNGFWYGRGTVDNKGQHQINLAGLKAVLDTRGKLGFNAKYLIEMGEERGSPGLREICREHKEKADQDRHNR